MWKTTTTIVLVAATAAAEVGPGMGADDDAATAVKRMKEMHGPPSGLLIPASEMEALGVSGDRFPNPAGRFPVVDHPVEQVPLFDPDPAKPLADIMAALRKELTDPLYLTWQPMAAWTYQHATKVKSGAPHAKSLLWEAIAGTWTLWQNHGDYGQVSVLLQNNVGVGTPLEPYMGPSVGNPTVVNNILVGPGASVQLYWQQSFFEDTLRWRIGKISDASFFDRNAVAYDPISGFMALDFNQSLTNPFPSRGFGTTLSADLSDDMTLRAGTLNSASAGDTSGFDGLAIAHLFTICELDIRMFPEIGGRQREGHLRFMGWYNAIPDPFGDGNTGGPGVTFNMDQAVADHATVFARVGWGSQDVTVSNFAVSCGIGISSPFGLQSCQTGIAVEYAHITPLGRAVAGFYEPGALTASEIPGGVYGVGHLATVGGAGDPMPGGEQLMLEWYWRVRMTESTDTGPVIQVVRDPGVGIDTSVIWGWRTTISF
jgi:hypothetical protein